MAEVVHHFARYYPDPADPDVVIDQVGLTDKRDARTTKLSGGQRRRLDVALAIVGRPEVVFLDEPTTGFDPEARRTFWGLIDGLQERGTTIVLTTHYLDEAEALADRVGVIVAGRLVDVGPPGHDRRPGPGDRGRHLPGPRRYRADRHRRHRPRSSPRSASRFGGEIPELTVSRPTLEDVYLQMIGA